MSVNDGTAKKLLAEDVKDLEILRKEFEHGIIERVANGVGDRTCSEIKDYLKLLEQA